VLKKIPLLGDPKRPGGWYTVAELGHASALCVPSAAALGTAENATEKNKPKN